MSSHSKTTLGRSGSEPFQDQVAPHRGELLRLCYRMLGSFTEAEDVLQEVLLRAWRGAPRFEERASFRTWLYRIATNACLTQLSKRPRRRSVPELRSPAALPGEDLAPPVDALYWIEPFPDNLLGDDAEALTSRKETVALAFVVALQQLAPRQRGVLLLREVVGYEVSEVAAMLEMSVAAVNSALARARSRLARVDNGPASEIDFSSLGSIGRALLNRYVEAWESGDVATLVSLLRHDASFSMPPFPSWFRGRAAIQTVLFDHVFSDGRRFRLRPTSANGFPAFAIYKAEQGSTGFHPHGIQVLWLDRGRVSAIVTFLNPRLVDDFGFSGQIAIRPEKKTDRDRLNAAAREV